MYGSHLRRAIHQVANPQLKVIAASRYSRTRIGPNGGRATVLVLVAAVSSRVVVRGAELSAFV
jgi:hypothetical protein